MKYLKTILYTIKTNTALIIFHLFVLITAVSNTTGEQTDSIIQFFFAPAYAMLMTPLIIGYYIGYREIKKKPKLIPWVYVLINFLILFIGNMLLMSGYYSPFPIKL